MHLKTWNRSCKRIHFCVHFSFHEFHAVLLLVLSRIALIWINDLKQQQQHNKNAANKAQPWTSTAVPQHSVYRCCRLEKNLLTPFHWIFWIAMHWWNGMHSTRAINMITRSARYSFNNEKKKTKSERFSPISNILICWHALEPMGFYGRWLPRIELSNS